MMLNLWLFAHAFPICVALAILIFGTIEVLCGIVAYVRDVVF